MRTNHSDVAAVEKHWRRAIDSTSPDAGSSRLSLAFIADQVHVGAAKVIPSLLSHQGKRLLNGVFCVVPAEAFKAVSVWFCAGDMAGTDWTLSRFL